MSRYFIEVSYKGTNYSGFQKQDNANTVQSEIERAISIVLKQAISLTGSSRTDAGVHALQNFFHFDYEGDIQQKMLYNLNAIINDDIVLKRIFPVPANSHCRFDAISREYKYYINKEKNPFIKDQAYYYPYKIDIGLMQEAAKMVKENIDFTSFSKRNTQVYTFNCKIIISEWVKEAGCLVYHIKGNRFLRGMVKGLVSTMLLVGRKKISLGEFKTIIDAKDCTKANFAVPAQGLFLLKVQFPDSQDN